MAAQPLLNTTVIAACQLHGFGRFWLLHVMFRLEWLHVLVAPESVQVDVLVSGSRRVLLEIPHWLEGLHGLHQLLLLHVLVSAVAIHYHQTRGLALVHLGDDLILIHCQIRRPILLVLHLLVLNLHLVPLVRVEVERELVSVIVGLHVVMLVHF